MPSHLNSLKLRSTAIDVFCLTFFFFTQTASNGGRDQDRGGNPSSHLLDISHRLAVYSQYNCSHCLGLCFHNVFIGEFHASAQRRKDQPSAVEKLRIKDPNNLFCW